METNDKYSALEKLSELLEKGILTKEEFEIEKYKILNTPIESPKYDSVRKDVKTKSYNKSKTCWYNNSVWLCLSILFWPLFVYGLFKNEIIPKKNKIIIIGSLFALFVFVFFMYNQNGSNASIHSENIRTVNGDKEKKKIELFNDVPLFVQKLCEYETGGMGHIHIKEFSLYHNDGISWIASTDYIEFGNYNDNGIRNNIAFYLEGDSQNSINALKIVMNLNKSNFAARKIAEDVMFSSIQDVLRILELDQTIKMYTSIKKFRDCYKEYKYYTIRFYVEKTGIKTYNFIIQSKS